MNTAPSATAGLARKLPLTCHLSTRLAALAGVIAVSALLNDPCPGPSRYAGQSVAVTVAEAGTAMAISPAPAIAANAPRSLLPWRAAKRFISAPFAGDQQLYGRPQGGAHPARSEEHTSELQSPYDLICRLL